MSKTFELGNTRTERGQVSKGRLGGVELADGSVAPIPLVVVNGVEEGPVLTVVSAIHGTEVSTVGALIDVIKSVDPKQLRGTLVAIPGGNPIALRTGNYITPVDSGNLSGPWYLPPIEAQRATITQRMARHINEALEVATCVIDMHANPLPSMPFVLKGVEIAPDEWTKSETHRIAEAFGATVITSLGTHSTNIRASCTKRGKPALTAELAGNIYMWDSINKVGAIGTRNVMRAMGMLEGPMEKQDIEVMKGDFVFVDYLVTQRGGLMYVLKRPGEKVAKGDTVIEILNLYGDVVERVLMPVDGYCWSFTGGMHGSHAVSEGEKLAYVFAEAAVLGEGSPYAGKPV